MTENRIVVSSAQIDEAASLINNAIENHATAVDLTGYGVMVYILETLNITVELDSDNG